MSLQCIAYPTADGVAIIYPADPNFTAEQIAKKDVPEGVPYVLLNAADVPTDRTFRDAWSVDFSSPSGFGISDAEWQQLYAPQISAPQPPTTSGELEPS